MEQVHFAPEATVRDKVISALELHRRWLKELIPDCDVEHVGSTAVAGTLTKGDLDILVLVTMEAFPCAEARLAERLDRNAPSWRSDVFSSFKDDAADPPLGVQLAVRGRGSEHFIRFRDMLAAEPRVLAEYNSLKAQFEGGEMTAYRERKGEFIERVLATRQLDQS